MRNDGGGTFADATSGPLGDAGRRPRRGVGRLRQRRRPRPLPRQQRPGEQAVPQRRRRRLRRRRPAAHCWLHAGRRPAACAWGDYDNDGDLDLYLPTSGTANKLLRNDGGGAFADVTSGPLWRHGLRQRRGMGRLRQRRRPRSLPRQLPASPTSCFATTAAAPSAGRHQRSRSATPGAATGVAWGDYDNDGDLDLYLANTSTRANKLFRNDGTAPSRTPPAGPLGRHRGSAGAWPGATSTTTATSTSTLPMLGSANKLLRNDGGGAFADATSRPCWATPGYGSRRRLGRLRQRRRPRPLSRPVKTARRTSCSRNDRGRESALAAGQTRGDPRPTGRASVRGCGWWLAESSQIREISGGSGYLLPGRDGCLVRAGHRRRPSIH